jgi:hypothetical protein
MTVAKAVAKAVTSLIATAEACAEAVPDRVATAEERDEDPVRRDAAGALLAESSFRSRTGVTFRTTAASRCTAANLRVGLRNAGKSPGETD